jgi:tetratricopeptide (TPR) repeat protein
MNRYLRYFLAVSLAFGATPSSAQGRMIDSLQRMVEKAAHDTLRIKQMNKLSWQLILNGNYRDARAYLDKALELSKKIKYVRGSAWTYNNLGVVHLSLGEFSQALGHYHLAIGAAQAAGENWVLGNAWNNIGLVHRTQGNYPEALKHFLKSLKIRESMQDSMSIAASFQNIGNTYERLDNLDEALRNHRQSLRIRQSLRDRRGMAASYGSLSIIYRRLGQPDLSIENNFLALPIFRELDDRRNIATTLVNIGVTYNDLGNRNGALNMLKEALPIMLQLEDKQGLATIYLNMASVFVHLARPQEARRLLTQALDISREIGLKEELPEIYYNLCLADSLEGDHLGAFLNYKMYVSTRDSLQNEENTKRTMQTQMQYDFDKQQAADSIRNAEQLKQEALKHEQEIAQQRVYTYGGGIGFILMLVVAAVSFRAYRQKQRANSIIFEQKQLVEQKQKEILDSIYYARRIQQSLLPTEKYIYKQLKRIKKTT